MRTRFLLCDLLAISSSCDDGSQNLSRPMNVKMDFYAVAVDQDGKPLSDVKFTLTSLSMGGDAIHQSGKETRTPHEFRSDSNGKLTAQLGGFALDVSASLPGYRWLHDTSQHSKDLKHISTYNDFYNYDDWGTADFVPDARNPAVYVFVREGATTVTAKACRGGSDRQDVDGTLRRVANPSGFPVSPSIAALTYVESSAATAPSLRK